MRHSAYGMIGVHAAITRQDHYCRSTPRRFGGEFGLSFWVAVTGAFIAGIGAAPSFADDIRPLPRLWGKPLTVDVDWLAARETCLAPVVLVVTRNARLHAFDAQTGESFLRDDLRVEPGTRLIDNVGEDHVDNQVRQTADTPLHRISRQSSWVAVHGRFAISAFRLEQIFIRHDDRWATSGLSAPFWQAGAPLDPDRDARDDPEFLGGIVAAAQNDRGILIANAGRAIHLLRDDSGSALMRSKLTEEVQRIAPMRSGWALQTRRAGRTGVQFFSPDDAGKKGGPRYACHLGEMPPTWFDAYREAAMCVSPDALDVILSSGVGYHHDPARGAQFLAALTTYSTDALGRALLLTVDSDVGISAFDLETGGLVWSNASDQTREPCTAVFCDEHFAVRMQPRNADVINLISGRPVSSIALPRNERVLAAFLKERCLMVVSCIDADSAPRSEHGVDHETAAAQDGSSKKLGTLRAWLLDDGVPIGARVVSPLSPATRIAHVADTLIAYDDREISGYAIDLP